MITCRTRRMSRKDATHNACAVAQSSAALGKTWVLDRPFTPPPLGAQTPTSSPRDGLSKEFLDQRSVQLYSGRHFAPK